MNDFSITYDVDDELLTKLIELDKKFYKECDVGNFDLCKSFLTVNSDIYTVLLQDENPIGYICFYPLKSEVYSSFKSGKLKDYELLCDDILSFSNQQSFDCLFSSIVIDNNFQGTDALRYLLCGFKRKIDNLGLKINHVIFDCISKKGENLAKKLFNSHFIIKSKDGNIYEGDMQSFINNSFVATTQKVGCYLVNLKTKKIALIYRDFYDDWTFPKGHLEKGETLRECAIRETAEETKRVAEIVENIEPVVERYTTSKGENCECYMFVAVDNGKSDNTSTDTHDTFWIDIDEVENKLSYESLKNSWLKVKEKIKFLLQ